MVRAPLHFHGRLPVPEVAPLTYRDGVSQLELVYELSEYLKKVLHPSLQSTVDQVVADTERLLVEANTQYVDGVEEFQRIHDRFMSDVNGALTALNDTAVSDLVEDGTSLLGQILREKFENNGAVDLQISQRMGIITPDELTFAQLQAAADEAYETGKRLWAAGELDTTDTLVLRGDADLGGLTINYTGDSTAVQIGVSDENTLDSVGTTPRIIHPGRDWSRSVTGVEFVNVYSSVWTIPHVEGFTVGMDVIGDESGNVYNTYTIGHLYANKINQRLRGINGGWSNQNTYIGGRYSHLSSQGANVTGARHIELAVTEHAVNNNLWLNPSVEGSTAEYHIHISGSYNLFINGRYEASQPTVYIAPDSFYNHIMMGYQAQRINLINEGSNNNTIETTHQRQIRGGTTIANLVLQNSSGANATDVILEPGYDPTRESVQNNYRVKRSANSTDMKRATDEHPRLVLDHTNGLVQFGNGVSPVTVGLRSYGANVINAIGMPTTNTPSNTTTPVEWLEIRVDGVRSFIPLYR